MNTLRTLGLVLPLAGNLLLGACATEKAQGYTKGNVDDVLRGKGADTLTIIRKPECKQTAFEITDKNGGKVIVIQDDCKTKSEGI